MPTMTITSTQRDTAAKAGSGVYSQADFVAACVAATNFNGGVAQTLPYLPANEGAVIVAGQFGTPTGGALSGVNLALTNGTGAAVAIAVAANGTWTFSY